MISYLNTKLAKDYTKVHRGFIQRHPGLSSEAA